MVGRKVNAEAKIILACFFFFFNQSKNWACPHYHFSSLYSVVKKSTPLSFILLSSLPYCTGTVHTVVL